MEPGTLYNSGEPIIISNFEIVGFADQAAKGGQKIYIRHRGALTSDTPIFHTYAKHITNKLNQCLREADRRDNISQAKTILLIIKQDKTAELWLDAAASMLKCIPKKNCIPGTVVLESDIADVTSMEFPNVNIGKKDSVIVLFREGWKFGLLFDFRHNDCEMNVTEMNSALGALYRELKYETLYKIIEEKAAFKTLLDRGWFPFAELIQSEYLQLINYLKNDWDITVAEKKIVEAFTDERVDHMLRRWLNKPHYHMKNSILEAAINAYKNHDFISTIKILSTEIEGILISKYPSNQKQNLKKLTQKAAKEAQQKTSSHNSLLLPISFEEYLKTNLLANFDPTQGFSTAGSRHAVAHGQASTESYTAERALQTLLTLDQLAFYT